MRGRKQGKKQHGECTVLNEERKRERERARMALIMRGELDTSVQTDIDVVYFYLFICDTVLVHCV